MKTRKFFISTVAILGATVLSVPVFAYTIDFDVTYPNDTYSYRSQKDDDEQRFYVHGSTFSSKHYALYCTSISDADSSKGSETITVYVGKEDANGAYTHFAPAGGWYRMHTYARKKGFHVTGRYTP